MLCLCRRLLTHKANFAVVTFFCPACMAFELQIGVQFGDTTAHDTDAVNPVSHLYQLATYG
jgi:hypothetical protein